MSKSYVDCLSTRIRYGDATPAEEAIADAAPDLLEACRAASSAHAGVETCDMPEWLDMIEAAIAKAEGPSLGEWLMDDKPGRFRSSELGGAKGGAA